jgi:hypothetical protein
LFQNPIPSFAQASYTPYTQREESAIQNARMMQIVVWLNWRQISLMLTYQDETGMLGIISECTRPKRRTECLLHTLVEGILNITLCGAENWLPRKTEQKYLKSFEMLCWRRMHKIS